MSPSFVVTEWLSFVAHAAAKASLLLLVLLAADLLLPRRWGAWRNLLWRTGLIAVLLLPALMPVLPRLTVPVAVANRLPAAQRSALPSLAPSWEKPVRAVCRRARQGRGWS